ncbi:hypothetical protein [Streptomyces hydrogenans]|uniref:hypothetical protein n=1 Tax=Streptomyces hydrogenans TaxID=1873719 RepID=UPI00383028FC
MTLYESLNVEANQPEQASSRADRSEEEDEPDESFTLVFHNRVGNAAISQFVRRDGLDLLAQYSR